MTTHGSDDLNTRADRPRVGARRIISLLSGVTLLAAASIVRAGEALPLSKAMTVICEWGRGSVTTWTDGKPTTKLATWGPPPMNISTYDVIDVAARRARLVAQNGAGDVEVVFTAAGLTFVEWTAVGNLSVATVFETPLADGSYRAIISRHMASLFGDPLPSQYAGRCRVTDWRIP